MQEKQKVTLYLPPELHRQLKIKAAVDSEPMSAIAEKALIFFLEHPELVDENDPSFGQTHRVYTCPDCTSSVVMRDGGLVSLRDQPSVLGEQEIPLQPVTTLESDIDSGSNSTGEEQLVPC